MEHKVIGCNNCPMCELNDLGHICQHPTEKTDIETSQHYPYDPITPHSCPLKKESITLTFFVTSKQIHIVQYNRP